MQEQMNEPAWKWDLKEASIYNMKEKFPKEMASV